jgi:hypothetical protein
MPDMESFVAIEAAQTLRINLIDSDPGMAAVGLPPRTMVAVAVSNVLPKPAALGLVTVNLSPSLGMVVPTVIMYAQGQGGTVLLPPEGTLEFSNPTPSLEFTIPTINIF